jgi:formate hydrogenlyase subunit 6/NADH:ubiquinone oxidoreductase subunit I
MEEDDEDIDFTYMELINDHLCIGCKACQKACPKGCFVHKPLEVKNDQI